ncbi:MAG: hypothetical protein IJ663_06335 [Spirochaetales bacterium]|jgi:hypothetical protein|nr:hypothetical protein [Spirochaetales bacterium]
MSTKRSKIKAFDTFGKALCLLESQDRELYSWPRNRLALSHALAMHISSLIDQKQKLSVDLCPVLNRSPKALNPDILVHNRETKTQLLAIICRTDYLTESEQDELIRFRRESKCDLVLALSFMVQKNYMLIYVANEDRIEYYHFERNSQTMEPVRSRSLETQADTAEQLTLDRILKRH